MKGVCILCPRCCAFPPYLPFSMTFLVPAAPFSPKKYCCCCPALCQLRCSFGQQNFCLQKMGKFGHLREWLPPQAKPPPHAPYSDMTKEATKGYVCLGTTIQDKTRGNWICLVSCTQPKCRNAPSAVTRTPFCWPAGIGAAPRRIRVIRGGCPPGALPGPPQYFGVLWEPCAGEGVGGWRSGLECLANRGCMANSYEKQRGAVPTKAAPFNPSLWPLGWGCCARWPIFLFLGPENVGVAQEQRWCPHWPH